MKITDVRPILLTSSYGVAGAHIGRRSACFVQVETDEGITGLGETYAGVYVPEIAAQIVEFFKPHLVGRDALNPNDAHRVAYWVSSYFGRTGLTVMVLSAIENALWDVLGKAKGVPVHRLLGGAVHERLPLYASGATPTLSPEQLVAQAAGARASYAIDAVQNFNARPWSIKQVVRMLEILEPYDLAWAEEMLPPYDPATYAKLRMILSTPISGGEGITTSTPFDQWLRAGAFDLAQPDATIIGGISEARRACESAAAHGVQVALHVWGCAQRRSVEGHGGIRCGELRSPWRQHWVSALPT